MLQNTTSNKLKTMNNRVFKVFVDFDGTITMKDVGDAIFLKFCDEKIVSDIIEKLLSDRISAKQCWVSLCKIAKIPGKKELNDFIDVIEIDSTFHEFVEFCHKNKIEFYVLSDGFDYYINRIFEREGLENINFYSNKLEITEDNHLIPHFPYLDINCQTSANCKRNHIINHSSDDEFTVFIGDGNSDKYTAQFCDFIFAKADLLKFCEKERITYFPFNDFKDVIDRMENLISRKRLKKRHQAELKRKEVYISE
jgi:2-hydroxy-3-keto-5-methylthiopentenyl-1-phosphate phosphatase